MRRFVSNLQISGKLLLTPLIVIPFLFGLTVAGYVGLSYQKDITGEIFNKRFRGYEHSSQVVAGLADIHGNVLKALHRTGIRTDAEGTVSLVKEQAGPIGSIAQSIQEVLSSGGLHEDEKTGYRAALEEVREYRKLIEGSGNAISSDPDSTERFAAVANDRFLKVVGRLRALQEIENRLGKESYQRSLKTFTSTVAVIATLFVAAVLLSVSINIFIMRKTIIAPIRSIERAAKKVVQGDLSFDVEAESTDEIGRVGGLLKESFLNLEGVLQRIKELSDRILAVVAEVERESERVLKGAEAESAATNSISGAVLELNAAAAGIMDNTEGLASSAADASASIEQMVSSIRSINEIIQDLEGIVESTSASIGQLSTAIKGVAANSEELAGASEETLTAISEIAATIKEVESNAKESAMLSEKVTSEAATLGMASIAKTIEGMKDIALSVRETEECIRILGNRSQEIEKILGVIESVNDETNLLSLNAAILAAEAGEHGKGFSVVADEISALSGRTEDSRMEIAALIQAVQQEVGNAAETMQKGIRSVEGGLGLAKEAEETLKKILNSSKKSSEMTLSIKRTTEEQARVALVVTEATERVKDMIGHVVGATSEQSKSVGLIADAAEKMRKLSLQVSKATGEQATSSGQIARATELVSERSREISRSLSEHKKGSQSILNSLDAVKDIPVENRELAFRISKTLWNLQKDAELLKAEMERFSLSGKRGHSLRLGVVPLKEPSVMFRKFTPFSEYLSRKLGIKVDLRVAIDMEGAVKDIGQNVTQICAMGPANYIEAKRRYGVKVIAKALRKGRPFHHAAVVVKNDSGIWSLQDLKGKSFAFGGVTSSTGFIMPLATLKDAGIGLSHLSRHEFLGRHDEVVKAVLEGNFDAGALMEEAARGYSEKGLRILALSVPIPEFNMCCNREVDEEMMNDIRNALISLDVSRPDDATVLQSLGKDCTGFEAATEAEYNVFREKILAIEADATTEHHSRLSKGRP